jgi:hypothetical protein
LFTRALPVLFFFVIVLLLTGEVWLQAGQLTGIRLTATIGLIVGVGVSFLLTRIPNELQELDGFETVTELKAMAASAPLDDIDADAWAQSMKAAPLSRREWGNVVLVLLVSQAMQVLVVSLTMFAFLVVFGCVAIAPETVSAYLGGAPVDVVLSWNLLGEQFELTAELLQVSAFLAAFSGLFFTISSLTDATYRAEFRAEVTNEIREAFAVRRVYLTLHSAQTP